MPMDGTTNCTWVPKAESNYAEWVQVCTENEPVVTVPAPEKPKDVYLNMDPLKMVGCDKVGVKYICQ